jgi:1-acyl-sn-glycerol-3-phosphate acyltransferase
VSIIVRSILFNLSFYLVLFIYLIVALPTLLMPRRVLVALVKSWARMNFWLLRVICKMRMEVIGREKIGHGPLLVASKHQSMWETFALMAVFDDPAYILKRELMWIPFFGWCAWKTRMIPVDRGARSQALAGMTRRARAEVERGRQLIIFPEGTRRAPGAEPKNKFGVVHLYAEIGVPCLPVALNSGLYWPRRSFRRYPGTLKVEILDPIAPGMDKQDFFARLQADIENATARLVVEGERDRARAMGQ